MRRCDTHLENARQHVERGKLRIRELWKAEADLHRDRADLEAIVALATLVSYRSRGLVHGDAASLLEVGAASVDRLDRLPSRAPILGAPPNPPSAGRMSERVRGGVLIVLAVVLPVVAARFGDYSAHALKEALAMLGIASALASAFVLPGLGKLLALPALGWSAWLTALVFNPRSVFDRSRRA